MSTCELPLTDDAIKLKSTIQIRASIHDLQGVIDDLRGDVAALKIPSMSSPSTATLQVIKHTRTKSDVGHQASKPAQKSPNNIKARLVPRHDGAFDLYFIETGALADIVSSTPNQAVKKHGRCEDFTGSPIRTQKQSQTERQKQSRPRQVSERDVCDGDQEASVIL